MKYGWQLQKSNWLELKNALKKREWKRQNLLDEYAVEIPNVEGVYLICASPKDVSIEGDLMDRLYNAIYAGHSSNLHSRFRNHVKGYGNVKDAKRIFKRLDFWYCEVNGSDMKRYEQILINTLGPTGNKINSTVKARIGDAVPAGVLSGDKL